MSKRIKLTKTEFMLSVMKAVASWSDIEKMASLSNQLGFSANGEEILPSHIVDVILNLAESIYEHDDTWEACTMGWSVRFIENGDNGAVSISFRPSEVSICANTGDIVY